MTSQWCSLFCMIATAFWSSLVVIMQVSAVTTVTSQNDTPMNDSSGNWTESRGRAGGTDPFGFSRNGCRISLDRYSNLRLIPETSFLPCNESLRVECMLGFTLRGNAIVDCQCLQGRDTALSPFPRCLSCKRAEAETVYVHGGDNHKLQVVDFPKDVCSDTSCPCQTNVSYTCGKGMTIAGSNTARCSCDSTPPIWVMKPACRGCQKIKQHNTQDTRLFPYPADRCDQHHCECGVNVTISCDGDSTRLSGSPNMTCECSDATKDATWQYAFGSEPRCIAVPKDPETPSDQESSSDVTMGIGIAIGVLALIAMIIAGLVFFVWKNNKPPISTVGSNSAPMPWPNSPGISVQDEMFKYPYYNELTPIDDSGYTMPSDKAGTITSLENRGKMPLPQEEGSHHYFTLNPTTVDDYERAINTNAPVMTQGGAVSNVL